MLEIILLKGVVAVCGVCVCVCVYGTWTVCGPSCSCTGPRTLSLFGKHWASWVVWKLLVSVVC